MSTGVQPMRASRQVATSWTRPLQYGVCAWYAFSALFAFTFPLWMSGVVTSSMTESMVRHMTADPNAVPHPELISNFVTAVVAVLVASLFVISAVAIAGAIRRWIWIYHVLIVLLVLGAIEQPVAFINLATAGSVTSAPSWVVLSGAITALPAIALSVLMLVGLVRSGPWAMKPEPSL